MAVHWQTLLHSVIQPVSINSLNILCKRHHFFFCLVLTIKSHLMVSLHIFPELPTAPSSSSKLSSVLMETDLLTCDLGSGDRGDVKLTCQQTPESMKTEQTPSVNGACRVMWLKAAEKPAEWTSRWSRINVMFF